MKKKRIIIIVSIILLLIILSVFLLFFFNNKERDSYVKDHNIKVLSPNRKYSIPIMPYTKDENKNIIELEDVKFESTEATYSFYDYKVTNPDEEGNVVHKFSFHVTVPVEFTTEISKEIPYFKYTYLFVQPAIFDYYTGSLFKEKDESLNGSVNYYEIVNYTEDDMAFTEFNVDEETYKVGVKIETVSKWDGIVKTIDGNGIKHSKDTSRVTGNVYIKAPEDYDGIMIALPKKSSNLDGLKRMIEYNKKYEELKEQSKETGEKSQELIDIEDNNKKVYKLLDPKYQEDKECDPDEFYVFNIKDIKKIMERI